MCHLRTSAKAFRMIPVYLAYGIMTCVFAPRVVAGEEPPTLCRILEAIEPGQHQELVLSGIYSDGVLYDPLEPLCRFDVQPSTCVEFPSGIGDYGRLGELLKKSRRAAVKLSGTLYAPGAISFTKNHASDVQYLVDFRNSRYCKDHEFRTKFVVENVLSAEPVPDSAAWAAVVGKPKAGSEVVRLLSADLPVYPARARIVGAEGTVVVEFDVKDGAAEHPTVVRGNELLTAAAISNVRSWKFEKGTPQHLTCTFAYKLERRLSGSDENDVVEARLPYYVRIVAPRNGW